MLQNIVIIVRIICIYTNCNESSHFQGISYFFYSVDSVDLSESQNTTLVWQEGISITHGSGQILLEPMTFPDEKPGIKISVRNNRSDFKDLGFVVDHIETLIKEWYPGTMKYSTKCD